MFWSYINDRTGISYVGTAGKAILVVSTPRELLLVVVGVVILLLHQPCFV